MKIKKDHRESGFNLIEGAIVLSIISALIGIVVIGRELVNSSKVVTVISELAYFSQAKEQFMQQYKYRPGDMPYDQTTYNFDEHTGIRPDCVADSTHLGDGKWDEIIDSVDDFDSAIPYEVDYGFNQLSLTGLIKQRIMYDPCEGAGERIPGTHRPASDMDSAVGYTFINNIFVPDPVNGWQQVGLYALRVGAHDNDSGNDRFLRLGGKGFTATFHREIDAKIDQPDTPWSGKYVTTENCYDTNGYRSEDDANECPGNLLEMEPVVMP